MKAAWATEAALCTSFMEGARAAGWQCFPETFEFDMVLVSPRGLRFGVEAKLRPNLQVLAQAIKRSSAVHARLVLVPQVTGPFVKVARALRVLAFPHDRKPDWYFTHDLANLERRAVGDYIWTHEVKATLPGFVAYAEAGVPSPRKMTKWKLAAVKFCLDHAEGTFTRADFLAADLQPALWLKQRWIVPAGTKKGPKGRAISLYALSPTSSDRPDRKYPEIAQGFQKSKAAA